MIFACDAYKIVFCFVFAKLTDKAKCVRISKPVHVYFTLQIIYMYGNILTYTTYKFDIKI